MKRWNFFVRVKCLKRQYLTEYFNIKHSYAWHTLGGIVVKKQQFHFLMKVYERTLFNLFLFADRIPNILCILHR